MVATPPRRLAVATSGCCGHAKLWGGARIRRTHVRRTHVPRTHAPCTVSVVICDGPPVYPYLGPTYNPASTSPSSIAKRVLVVACVGVGVLFMAAILVAVAIPTFLSVKAASAGTGWFNGGVPGWPTVTVPGMGSTSSGAVVETWEVQGADFSGPVRIWR